MPLWLEFVPRHSNDSSVPLYSPQLRQEPVVKPNHCGESPDGSGFKEMLAGNRIVLVDSLSKRLPYCGNG